MFFLVNLSLYPGGEYMLRDREFLRVRLSAVFEKFLIIELRQGCPTIWHDGELVIVVKGHGIFIKVNNGQSQEESHVK